MNPNGDDISGVLGDYDDADFFGLDDAGRPTGINANWGALGVTGVGTLVAVGVQQMSSNGKVQKASELIGLGTAVVTSGAMIAFKKTRSAGWAGLFASLANHGPRILADYLSETAKAGSQARTSAVMMRKAGGGAPASVPTTTEGFRGGVHGVEIQEIPAFAGGLGLTMPEATRALGSPPHPELPQLVGTHLGQAQQQVSLLGGPALMSLGGHFGSTHFNKAA